MHRRAPEIIQRFLLFGGFLPGSRMGRGTENMPQYGSAIIVGSEWKWAKVINARYASPGVFVCFINNFGEFSHPQLSSDSLSPPLKAAQITTLMHFTGWARSIRRPLIEWSGRTELKWHSAVGPRVRSRSRGAQRGQIAIVSLCFLPTFIGPTRDALAWAATCVKRAAMTTCLFRTKLLRASRDALLRLTTLISMHQISITG